MLPKTPNVNSVLAFSHQLKKNWKNLRHTMLLKSLFNNRMVREELGPRGIWGLVHGVGLVQGVTRSGLVCDSPSARSADAREARFLVELK